MRATRTMRSSFAVALAAFCIVGISAVGSAQSRYKDIVFGAATATMNVQFGVAPAVNGTPQPLLLDFFAPTGDTQSARPLIIFIHGGSLISGERNGMEYFCTDAAKRGYAAATIDYRLGIEAPKGTRTILEALLRGVQDTKAAVRFFHAHAAEYGIDTTHIFLAGSSAGSMVAVHYAYWDEDEIPGDVDQGKWGDIEGTSGNPGFPSAVNGVVNYCGALVDPTWIDAGEPPVANFHGLLDQVVPPDSGVSTDFGIELFGGVAVSRMATRQGIYNQGAFFPQMGHGGNEDSLRAFSANFLYSLIVLSSAVPQDFGSGQLTEHSLSLFRYYDHTFVTTAIDTGGIRIVLPQGMIGYSCDALVGTIAPTGIFTPSDHTDSGYVYATLNAITDSCFVRTYDFAYFRVMPRVAVTDTVHPLTLRVDPYDADSVYHYLPIETFALTSSNPTVGTIDAAGIFTGVGNGSTNIVASFHGYSDTSLVRVECASGIVSLDQLETADDWTADTPNLDSLAVTTTTAQSTMGSASIRIGYKLTYSSSMAPYMAYLSHDLLVFGIPDSIYLDVRSDGRRHRVYYRFSDAEGSIFRGSGLKYLSDSASFGTINAAMTGLTPIAGNSAVSYPLTLKRLEFQIAGVAVQGTVTSGSITIDNLRLKYPGTATGVAMPTFAPEAFALNQNYPNPFNPSTTIEFALTSRAHVTLTVYNMLGQQVAALVNEELSAGPHAVRFDASGLASGVYLYRLQAGAELRTRKLMLIR